MSAFRVKPATDPLEHERVEIERRRQRYNDRTNRILHAKTRMFGVDTLALDQQVKEKQEKERLEMERDVFYDDVSVLHARSVQEQEAHRQIDERKRNEELNHFRKLQEQEKRRKQYVEESSANQLYDTDTLFLKFQGEDPKHGARVKAQQQQQQDWLAQQIHDLSSKESRDRQEDADYDSYQGQILELKRQQEEEAARVRRKLQEENVEFNRTLVQKKMSTQSRDEQLNQALDDMELSNQMNSNFLNEGVKGQSSNFKGFSTSQRQRILDEQHQQMQEHASRRQRVVEESRAYDQQQEDIRRSMVKADRQQQAYKAQALKNVAMERQLQAKEKTMRYDYLDNVVYTGQITEEFFEGFGKSCR